MWIVVPKRMPDIARLGLMRLPWFFLGGPIRGGGDWQARFCLLLQRLMGTQDFVVVVPCRWGSDHPLAKYFIAGKPLDKRQKLWERGWLKFVGDPTTNGCNIFYLATQVEPRPPELGVFARD